VDQYSEWEGCFLGQHTSNCLLNEVSLVVCQNRDYYGSSQNI
jgi:hypothetical protein